MFDDSLETETWGRPLARDFFRARLVKNLRELLVRLRPGHSGTSIEVDRRVVIPVEEHVNLAAVFDDLS